MPRYSDEAYDDACDEKAYENRECAIDSCQEHMEGFAWRWRIVESANAKIPSLRITDPKKANSLASRIKHLEKWCESAIDDELSEMVDSASEAKDPYAYRGLSRSDF